MKFDGSKPGPGRPKGSRNKLQEAFWKDFAAAWETHGPTAIQTVAQDDPATFLKVAASVMPKDVEMTVEHRSVMRMPEPARTSEEWQTTAQTSFGSPIQNKLN